MNSIKSDDTVELAVSRDIERRFLKSQSLYYYLGNSETIRFCKFCMGKEDYSEEMIVLNDIQYFLYTAPKHSDDVGKCSNCSRMLLFKAEFFAQDGKKHFTVDTNISEIALQHDDAVIDLRPAMIIFYDHDGKRYCSACCGQPDYNLQKLMFAGMIFTAQQVIGLVTSGNCYNCHEKLPTDFV